nr:hypothetical protein GCM10023233_12630 [Brevibacterium otitidis]
MARLGGMHRISVVRAVDGSQPPFSVASKLVTDEQLPAHLSRAAEIAAGSDVIVVPAPLARSTPAVVVMDVDSTFIENEVIDLLAAEAGAEKKVAKVTEKAMRGELDFEESLRARVKALKGLPVSVLDEVRAAITPTGGAAELVSLVQSNGGRIGLVSGGFTQILSPLAAEYGITDYAANTLEVADGVLTGKVTGTIVDAEYKRNFLRSLCAEAGVPVEAAIAIGDGANDALMAQEAGLGIAFCPKPALAEVADATISVRRLDAVWAAVTGRMN